MKIVAGLRICAVNAEDGVHSVNSMLDPDQIPVKKRA